MKQPNPVVKKVKSVKCWCIKENNKLILQLIFSNRKKAEYVRRNFAMYPNKQKVVRVIIKEIV